MQYAIKTCYQIQMQSKTFHKSGLSKKQWYFKDSRLETIKLNKIGHHKQGVYVNKINAPS